MCAIIKSGYYKLYIKFNLLIIYKSVSELNNNKVMFPYKNII